MRRKMRIGDYIECNGLEGQVEDILVRETYIRQTDGQLVITPNSMLFKEPLTFAPTLTTGARL
ncbi:MAG: mechanosensitive ion channel [Thiolinea sp.]